MTSCETLLKPPSYIRSHHTDNRETKAFGAFVRQMAKAGLRQAAPLEIYVRRADDGVKEVRQEIENDIGRGLITEERAKELQILVTCLLGFHKTHGHVEESHNSADWVSLGNGAHMRRTHLDENYEKPTFKAACMTVEDELTKENDEET